MAIAPKGFTLLQLILAVVIAGILAAISIPNYNKLRERTFAKEAIANLKLIAAAERAYEIEEDTYVSCSCEDSDDCDAAGGCNTLLRLELDPKNWSYNVDSLSGGTGFSVQANRQGSSGYLNCEYTLDDTPNNEPVAGDDCP